MGLYTELLRDFNSISSWPANIFAANNLYDVEHTFFLTGGRIRPQLLPSLCMYAGSLRSESRTRSLLLFYRIVETVIPKFTEVLDGIVQRANGTVQRTDEYIPWPTMMQHPAVGVIPYHKSTTLVLEMYASNMPLFLPSLDFLVELELNYGILTHRVLWLDLPVDQIEWAHPPGHGALHSPTDTRNADSVRHWLQFSDFYSLPFITYFESWEGLADTAKMMDPV